MEVQPPNESEVKRPELEFRMPSSEEEFGNLWKVLNELPWYVDNGYQVNLPQHPKIQEIAQPIIQKSVDNPWFHLSSINEAGLRAVFEKEIYNTDDYKEALEKLQNAEPDIKKTFPRLGKLNKHWGFKLFPKYDIVLTRYGTGGTYDAEKGKVLVGTQLRDDQLRPASVVVHEIVHIGIEEDIVKADKLKTWEKERLVDKMCCQEFPDLFPASTLQPQGDVKIDPYITPQTINNLPHSIDQYVTQFPTD